MQKGKCCYCEQKIPSEGHQKCVDHFHPQSKFKYLKNEWRNLLLACPQCNGKKSDHFPMQLTDNVNVCKVLYQALNNSAPGIIDPSNSHIDPEEYIDFVVSDDEDAHGNIFAKPGKTLGESTIEIIGLDDHFHTLNRKEFYEEVLYVCYFSLLRAFRSGDADRITERKNEMQDYLLATSKFAGFARAFARKKKLDTKHGITIPTGPN